MTVLTIDAGTTGVTTLLVDESGRVRARGYREFPQHYPQPGWVEHDAHQIIGAVDGAIDEALASAGLTGADLAAIGITNQRETTVLWDRRTGEPIAPAIVWQDRRTAPDCDRLRDEGHGDAIRAATGLVLDPYFSGTKVAWLLDHVDGARDDAHHLAFGTIDSWIVHVLTGGVVHATEPSNAARTMLFDIRAGTWSDQLCDLLRVPASLLPEVRPSAGLFGHTSPDGVLAARVPISGIAGDQQSALFGQGCWVPGAAKNTYGTGSFVLLNTGSDAAPSTNLLTTVAWDLGDGLVYALEGAIFATGATIQWLRDGLGLIADAKEAGPIAETVPDTGDVYLVPAFTGLGSPHWDPYARGLLIGITRGTTRAHLVRAAVEAMAYQTRDVIEAMEQDSGVELAELRVDGGASVMDLLCQLQADLLGTPVLRPVNRESTALGAAFLAGLGSGVWGSVDELADVWQLDRRFEPVASADADTRQARWREAVARAGDWARH